MTRRIFIKYSQSVWAVLHQGTSSLLRFRSAVLGQSFAYGLGVMVGFSIIDACKGTDGNPIRNRNNPRISLAIVDNQIHSYFA